ESYMLRLEDMLVNQGMMKKKYLTPRPAYPTKNKPINIGLYEYDPESCELYQYDMREVKKENFEEKMLPYETERSTAIDNVVVQDKYNQDSESDVESNAESDEGIDGNDYIAQLYSDLSSDI